MWLATNFWTPKPLNPVCCWSLQVRSVRSVTSVCQDRALSLATHINAKHEVDAKKVSVDWTTAC